MRLIKGTNLARWTAEQAVGSSVQAGQSIRGKDWLRRCARLIATVASAVHHAHQRGVIHRDLKPSNILVDTEGNPYVTDFGLARLLNKDSDLTLSGATVGTPSYMSPEQAQGRKGQLTTSSDVFSLGAILYELLTGEPPFKAETPLETVKQVLEAEPRRPSLVNLAVDRDLETICLKCLEKDPVRRYQSANELADDLERWQQHEPINARPATAPERLRKWVRRRPLRAALASFLFLSLIGFGTTIAINQVRLERERDLTQARLAEALLREGEAHAANQRLVEAKQKVLESRALAERKHFSTLSADLALLDIHRFSPPPLLTLRSHQGKATCVSISHDERTLYSGGDDGTIRCWSLPLGREERKRHAHPGGVSALAKSPDGGVLISAGVDGSLKLWDSGEFNERRLLTNHVRKVTALAFVPSGEFFASASLDGSIYVWHAQTGEAVKLLQTGQERITGIAFTPDGLRIVVVSEDGAGLSLWNLEAAVRVSSFPSAGKCTSLAVSADGKQLVSANAAGVVGLREWDGRPQTTPMIRLRSAARALAISSSRERILVGSEDGNISGWNYTKAQPTAELVLSDHQGAVTGIALVAEDRLIVSASEDGTIRVWDTYPEPGVTRFAEARYEVYGTAISPDGRLALSAESSGSLKLWDVAVLKRLRTFIGHQGTVFDADFSPDGRMAVSGGADGSLRIWELSSGKETHRFVVEPNSSNSRSTPLRCVAFLPGGQLVVAGEGPVAAGELQAAQGGERESRLHVWNASTGSAVTNFAAHRGGVLALSVSADGRTFVTGGGDGQLRVWDMVTWRERQSLSADSQPVNAAAFVREGTRCVSAGVSQTPILWDLANRRELSSFPARSSEVLSLAISQDESLLLGGLSRGGLKVWDLATGNELHTFAATDSVDVRSLTFAPGGSKVIAAANPIRLWDFGWVTELQRQEKEVQDARAMIEQNPASGPALSILAQWYEFRGVWDWAVELYHRAGEQGEAVAHLPIARSLWRLNRLEEAQAAMSKAKAAREAPENYLELCLSAIQREIQTAPAVNVALELPAKARVFPVISREGKDIWTTSHMALAELTETPGGGRVDERLVVGGWADSYHTLLQFDLSGLPTNALSAVLCLYCYEAMGSSNGMYLSRITADWDWRDRGTGLDRDRLWWADKPPTTPWGSEPLRAPVRGDWYKVDITELYNAWQSGVLPNYGLELHPVNTVNENFNRFYSSRYTNDPALQPQLLIVPGD